MRRVAAVIVTVAVTVAGLSACTGGGEAAGSGSPSANTEPLTEPMTFETAPGQDMSATLKASMAELGVSVTTAEKRTDKYGTWNPLKLDSGAPAYTLDTATMSTDDTTIEWDLSAVEVAWKTVADFLVTEWCDSELVWDDTAANRETAVARIDERSNFLFIDGTQFADYLEPFGGGLTPTLIGPWALDQDYENWRQDGLPDLVNADEADILTHQAFKAGLVAAEPAPYVLGQPRTYITRLAPIAVQTSEEHDFILWASITYARPIQVAGVDTPRYELDDAYLSFEMESTGQYALIVGFGQATIAVQDLVTVAAADVARLPVLTRFGGELAPNTLDVWGFRLPEDAVADSDKSCAQEAPADWSGTYVTFDLAELADGTTGCLEIWAFPSGALTALTEEVLYPTTKLWRIENDTIIGTVSVDAGPVSDSVTLMALDQNGRRLNLSADVPAGTGEEWATAMVQSIQLVG